MPCRTAIVCVVALVFAGNAFAIRLEFVTVFENRRIEGADVCFYVGNSQDALANYLAPSDVRCLSADHVITMPAGEWNVLAHYGDELVSAWPTLLEVTDGSERGYKRITVDLVPAAQVTLDAISTSLAESSHILFYYPGDSDTLAFAVPIPRGQKNVAVAADLDWIPIVASESTVLAVGAKYRLHAGEILVLPKLDSCLRTLVAWVRFDRSTTQRRGHRPLPAPPQIELITISGNVIRPTFGITSGAVNALVGFVAIWA